MATNANIIMGLQTPRTADPVNQMAQVLQLRGAMDERALMQRKMAEEQALNEAYRGALGPDGAVDRNRLMSVLAERNLGARIPAIQKQFADVDKATADVGKTRADTQKTELDAAQKRIDSWGSAMGWVRQNPTVENATAAVQHLVTLGVMPPEKAQQAVASLQANPTPEAIAQFAEMGMRTALAAKDQLPKFETRNLGATTETMAIDPVNQQVRTVNRVANTQSPDAVLQAQTSTANNQRTVGAQYANAAATREIANATKQAALIGANLKNEELRGKLDDRTRQKEASIASIGAQLGVIDKALTHPGRKTATGFSSVADPRNFIPGTDASDFRAVLDQIGGTAFLQAFESLKGGGQITEVEGKKATDAIARLSRAQSDSEFERSLRDLREVMAAGYKRAAGRDFSAPAPGPGEQQAAPVSRISSDAEYNALPSGAVFVGPDGKQRRKP